MRYQWQVSVMWPEDCQYLLVSLFPFVDVLFIFWSMQIWQSLQSENVKEIDFINVWLLYAKVNRSHVYTQTLAVHRCTQSVKMGPQKICALCYCDCVSHGLKYFIQSCFVLPRILCVDRLYICDTLMYFSVIRSVTKSYRTVSFLCVMASIDTCQKDAFPHGCCASDWSLRRCWHSALQKRIKRGQSWLNWINRLL